MVDVLVQTAEESRALMGAAAPLVDASSSPWRRRSRVQVTPA